MLSGAACFKEDDISVDDDMLAPGYGTPSQQVMDAVFLAARREALLFDPVYTGRGFAGLMGLIEKKIVKQNDNVLFMHTGGLPGIFAYQNEILASSS